MERVHVGWRERVILTQGIMGSGHMGTAPVNRQARLKTLPSRELRMWAIIKRDDLTLESKFKAFCWKKNNTLSK